MTQDAAPFYKALYIKKNTWTHGGKPAAEEHLLRVKTCSKNVFRCFDFIVVPVQRALLFFCQLLSYGDTGPSQCCACSETFIKSSHVALHYLSSRGRCHNVCCVCFYAS